MTHQVLLRLGLGVLTLWIVSALLYFSIELLPGNSATAQLGPLATPDQIAIVRKQLHLDQPAVERYFHWLGGFVTGDLGLSGVSGEHVSQIVGPELKHTAMLAFATLIFLIPLSLLFGALSAVWHDRAFDHVTATTTLFLISLPEFVVGAVLVLVFAVKLRLLPAVSLFLPGTSLLSQPALLVLPAVTLLAASLAQTIRMVRAALLDVLQSDFVQMARLKGAPERTVIFRHALPNAMAPVVQILVLNIAWLLGGVVLVEVVFQYPGIGAEMAHAITDHDYATVEAIGMIIAGTFIILNLIADLIVVVTNPRLRQSS